MGEFEPRVDPDVKPLPPDSKKSRNHAKKRNKRAKKQSGTREFDLRTDVYKLFGADVTQIPGLDFLAPLLFSEVGRIVSRSKNAASFVSWLALCPDNDISGGRGEGRARRITVPDNCFAWRPTRWTAVPRPWETICLRDGQEPSRIRPDHLGRAQRTAPGKAYSVTEAARATARL